MKTFKLTAIFFLLFSGVFGVSVFNHHLQLNVDSKLTGCVVSLPSTLLSPLAIFDKTVPPLDDNDLLVDDSLDDDDDGYFSPKEKTASENVCIDAASYNYSAYRSDNDLLFSSYHMNVYHPHRHFISLRVFRL